MDDIARKITFLMQIVLIILLWLLFFLTDTFCVQLFSSWIESKHFIDDADDDHNAAAMM